MTTPSSDSDAEGVGYFVGMLGAVLVVGLTIVSAIAGQSWWLVLAIGWLGSVVGATVGFGLGALLNPISRRLGSRAQLVLATLEIAAGLAVTVGLTVLAMINWA
jgi:membrane protein YqaA with SNARE-associated domain